MECRLRPNDNLFPHVVWVSRTRTGMNVWVLACLCSGVGYQWGSGGVGVNVQQSHGCAAHHAVYLQGTAISTPTVGVASVLPGLVVSLCMHPFHQAQASTYSRSNRGQTAVKLLTGSPDLTLHE